MSTSTIRVLALFSLAFTLGPLALRAEGPIYFNIPFGFNVESTAFAPGQYRVSTPAPGVLRIQSDNGGGGAMVITQAGERAKNPAQAVLTFNHYGDRYFLARLADPYRGWVLPTSRGEKELIAQRTSPKPFTVMASAKK